MRRLAAGGLRGGGESLPHLDAIQRSFGRHDVRGVRAYRGAGPAAAARALRAEAYTAGGEVAFARRQPDLGTAAHEAAHAVQQQAGVRPTGGVGRAGDRWEEHAEEVARRVVQSQPAGDLLDRVAPPFPARVAAAGSSAALVVQKKDEKFAGPTDAGGVLVNVAYPGYDRKNPLAGKALTDCAIDPWIQTAGEKSNSAVSSPGTPTDFALYSKAKDWDRTGGLVRDKNLGQAATRMHAINHRIDDTWTQDEPKNIFLGTAKSNNPNHLNLVERPVIASIREPGDNAEYESELAKAVEVQEQTTTDDVLFWPAKVGGAVNVSAQAVKHPQLQDAVQDPTSGDIFYGTALPPPKKKAKMAGGAPPPPPPVDGHALRVDAKTAVNNFFHAWVEYSVRPNYPAAWAKLPQYVQDNWTHEDAKKGADAVRTARLATFKPWALEAFPKDFTAQAIYYTASYKQAKPYRQEGDGPHQYSTDL